MSAAVQRIRQRHACIPGQLDLLADDGEPARPSCAFPDDEETPPMPDAEPAEPGRCPACDGTDLTEYSYDGGRTVCGWECRDCELHWRAAPTDH